jgi:hypothetical protein
MVKECAKNAISMRHSTRAEAKRIQNKGHFVAFMQAKVLLLYLRFQGRDFEAKELSMEYCWDLIPKQIGFLCSLKDICKPRKELTPEQTATKLVRNENTKIECDILRVTEAIMDEINSRVIDDKLKDEVRGFHDQGCPEAERDERRDRPYKLVMHLKKILPEPKAAEVASVVGREEPEDKPPPTTQEELRKWPEKTQRRKEELELAFNLNWTVTELETIIKVVDECWTLEETRGPPWEQCAKLRELILGGCMPMPFCEDSQRIADSAEQLMPCGHWNMNPGPTYHRMIKKKPSDKCPVPTEGVHRYFSQIPDPGSHPEELFVSANDTSRWFIRHPETEDNEQLELSFMEFMIKEDAIKKRPNSKHNTVI